MNHGRIDSAQFTTDGKRVITAGGGAARIWDEETGKPLTDLMKDDAVEVLEFAELSWDGKRVITADVDGSAVIWDISPIARPCPEWLPRLADAIAGRHLNERGLFEPLNEDAISVLKEIKNQLDRESTDNDWVVWGRWFLADRTTRTISPFSKITVPEYIEDRIKENTAESLAEAERLAVGNGRLLERIKKR